MCDTKFVIAPQYWFNDICWWIVQAKSFSVWNNSLTNHASLQSSYDWNLLCRTNAFFPFFSFIFPSILSWLRYKGIMKYAMLLCVVGAVKGYGFFLKMKEWPFSHSLLQWLGLLRTLTDLTIFRTQQEVPFNISAFHLGAAIPKNS